MASVRLTRFEADYDLLPPLCMFCGEPTQFRIPRSFSWFRSTVWLAIFLGVISFIVILLICTKRFFLRMPLCDRHKSDQLAWYRLSIFALFVAFGLVGAALMFVANHATSHKALWLIGTFIPGALGITVVILLMRQLNRSAIHVSEIRDGRWIRLHNVAFQFVDAIEEDRRRDYERKDEERREFQRWRREQREREKAQTEPIPMALPADDELKARTGERLGHES